MYGRTKSSLSKNDILSLVREDELLFYYFGINELPCLINSPFRKDENPSFAFFEFNNIIVYKDFATGDSGSLFKAIGLLLSLTYEETIKQIYSDIKNNLIKETIIKQKTSKSKSVVRHIGKTKLDVATRDWKQHDLEYWESFGITKEWLTYTEVYPISHVFITNTKGTFRIPADKYAYVYIERKENKISKKVYQPFNKDGFKWMTDHDKSVIALWTKIPKNGDKLCICSSVKDALCLTANTKIPAIAIQGEGFPISEHAINDLKARFSNIFILLDNDEPGLKYAVKLAENTGFTNVILPRYNDKKDISDLYKSLDDKEEFKKIINSIL